MVNGVARAEGVFREDDFGIVKVLLQRQPDVDEIYSDLAPGALKIGAPPTAVYSARGDKPARTAISLRHCYRPREAPDCGG